MGPNLALSWSHFTRHLLVACEAYLLFQLPFPTNVGENNETVPSKFPAGGESAAILPDICGGPNFNRAPGDTPPVSDFCGLNAI
jgi:hypothetical protein